MPSLPNYLRAKRKQLSLSQEEVAFLLGLKGLDKGSKVSRDENEARHPTLETALAYQAIYGMPISDLFAGLHEQVAQDVSARAKILSLRKIPVLNATRQETISALAHRRSNLIVNQTSI